MATYVEIDDTEVAPEAPGTSSLLTRLRDNALAYLGAPTGTILVCGNSSAPLGWTIKTDHNDKALRVVSSAPGSGGSSAFSTVFGKTATDGTAITRAQLPTDQVQVSGSAVSTNSGLGVNGSAVGGLAQTGATVATFFNIIGQLTSIFTTLTDPLGSGHVHTHPIDLRVSYVDVVRIEKAA